MKISGTVFSVFFCFALLAFFDNTSKKMYLCVGGYGTKVTNCAASQKGTLCKNKPCPFYSEELPPSYFRR